MSKYVLGESGARKLRAILNGRGESGSVHGVAPGLSFEDDFAHPFTVHWAESAGDSGAWVIWLPSDSCLLVDGEAVDILGELEDAGGDYPSGWYKLDCLDSTSGGDLYLNVHIPKKDEEEDESEGDGDGEGSEGGEGEEPEVTASFGSEPDEAEDGETVYPILIAKCSGRQVKSSVISAVVIGGGSGGGKKNQECVTSLNEETGDMAIIGGVGIEVVTNGKTIKVTLNEDKETEDEDPNEEGDPCAEHPGGGGDGVDAGGSGGGGGVDAGGPEGSGGGCSNCGGNSTVGGESAPGGGGGESGGESGGVQPGAHGTESSGVSTPNGKEATSVPTSGSSAAGSDSSGSGSSGSSGKSGSGLFNGSTIPKKTMEDTQAGAKTPLYGGTHTQLTDTKKMNQSPFKSDPNWHGSIEETQSRTKTPLYGGTHSQLTDTKKMNESPFKRK